MLHLNTPPANVIYTNHNKKKDIAGKTLIPSAIIFSIFLSGMLFGQTTIVPLYCVFEREISINTNLQE